jgi:hypothetical protein
MRPGGRVAVMVIPPVDGCVDPKKGKPPAFVDGRFDISSQLTAKMKNVTLQIERLSR